MGLRSTEQLLNGRSCGPGRSRQAGGREQPAHVQRLVLTRLWVTAQVCPNCRTARIGWDRLDGLPFEVTTLPGAEWAAMPRAWVMGKHEAVGIASAEKWRRYAEYPLTY